MTDQEAEAIQQESDRLQLRIRAVEQELETERMRVAACGVVAMANTPETAARARKMHPDYWCASVADVARMVDSEMALRARVTALEDALWDARDYVADYRIGKDRYVVEEANVQLALIDALLEGPAP